MDIKRNGLFGCIILFIEKKKQWEDTTVAYVTFALSQDATTALETLQSTKIGDNKINIKFAKTRSEQVREPRGGGFRKNANFEPLGGIVPEPPKKPAQPRQKQVKKKSRLIVRNLSFKVISALQIMTMFSSIAFSIYILKYNFRKLSCN